MHINLPALGHNRAFGGVAHHRIHRRLCELQLDLSARRQGHSHRLGRPHVDRPIRCNDLPTVGDFGTQKCNVAAAGRLECAFVEDEALRAIRHKAIVASQKVGVTDAQGRRGKARGADAAVFAKHNAIGIYQNHLPIRGQLTKDLRGIVSCHPVQLHAVGAGLIDDNLGVRANVERVPVNDRLVGRLVDGQGVADLRNGGFASSNAAPRGQCGSWQHSGRPTRKRSTAHEQHRNSPSDQLQHARKKQAVLHRAHRQGRLTRFAKTCRVFSNRNELVEALGEDEFVEFFVQDLIPTMCSS